MLPTCINRVRCMCGESPLQKNLLSIDRSHNSWVAASVTYYHASTTSAACLTVSLTPCPNEAIAQLTANDRDGVHDMTADNRDRTSCSFDEFE